MKQKGLPREPFLFLQQINSADFLVHHCRKFHP